MRIECCVWAQAAEADFVASQQTRRIRWAGNLNQLWFKSELVGCAAARSGKIVAQSPVGNGIPRRSPMEVAKTIPGNRGRGQ